MIRIAIVGGGPGGLMTAWLLSRLANQPISITLLEASQRTGGKILTPRFRSLPVSYEAGAAEFYDYSPIDHDPLKELVSELGLSISPMGGNSVFHNRRRLATLEDVSSVFSPAVSQGWSTFHEQARASISPREFYESDGSDPGPVAWPAAALPVPRFNSIGQRLQSPQLQTFLETMIHSDLAAEWSQTDVTYGLQNYLMNHPDYMRLYSIAGGNEQLVQRLLQSTPMQVRLNHQVLAVGRAAGTQIQLQIRHEDSVTEAEFDFAVLCLPVLPLRAIQFRGVRLADAMQRHLQQFDHPAHYLRVTLLFRRPFWKDWLADSWCMLDAWGGCCLYDETSRQPESVCGILGWLFAGDTAGELSQLSDDQLIRTAIETLPHGQAQAGELLLEGHVHRWLGAVSAMPGGEHATRLDLRHQPEPVEHPRLFLVGDYLFDSTLNGVLDSADCVASWIAAEMEQP
ncbi:MAG: flavin monoamine oxidase family protein [Planctomycetaceae bacterium]